MKMVTGDGGSGKCREKQVRSHKEEVKKEISFRLKRGVSWCEASNKQLWVCFGSSQFCKLGAAPYEGESRRFPLKSLKNARYVVLGVTHTKTLIWGL
jgi:hypothetical protein